MSNSNIQDLRFKVTIIGDINTGKTCFMFRAIGKPFPDSAVSLGGECESTIVQRPEVNAHVKLTFWDTAGQEKFQTTSSSYHRGAHACLVFYDISERDSFQNVSGWREEIIRYCSSETVLILVGNKVDRLDRKISYAEGKAMADKWDCEFFETSAKTKQGVDEVVNTIVDMLIKSKIPKKQTHIVTKKRPFSFTNIFRFAKK